MPNEGEEYTPEEWVQLFLEATPEKRLKVTRIVLEGHRKGTQCWLADHPAQLESLPQRIEASYRQGWQDALKTFTTEMEKTDGNV